MADLTITLYEQQCKQTFNTQLYLCLIIVVSQIFLSRGHFFTYAYIKFCLFIMPTQKEEVTYTDQEENRIRTTGGITSSIDNVGDESTETTAEYSFIEDFLRPEK